MNNQILRATILIFATLRALTCEAGVGDLDPNYGVLGLARIGSAASNGPIVGLMADGSLIYGSADSTVTMHKYSRTGTDGRPASGSLDQELALPPRFQANNLRDRRAAIRTAEGGLLIGGLIEPEAPILAMGGDSALVKLDANGRLLTDFGQAGLARLSVSGSVYLFGIPEALVFQADGRILAATFRYGGYFGESLAGGVVERLNLNGSRDLTFGANAGVAPISVPPCDCVFPTAMDVLPGGTIQLRIAGIGTSNWTNSGIRLDKPAADSTRPADVSQWQASALLPAGGMVLAGFGANSSELVIGKLRGDDLPDTRFGPAGTGIARIRSDAIAQRGAVIDEISRVAVSADGQHIYLVVKIRDGVDDLNVDCVLRIHAEGAASGALDDQFARAGVARLSNDPELKVTDIVEQSTGAVILTTSRDTALRLLGTDSPSPGAIGFATTKPTVATESAGSMAVRVSRTLGSSGTVSVGYATVPTDPGPYTATPGQDFDSVAGRLVWADGDVADKIISIPIRQDSLPENDENIFIELSAPQGGATLLSSRSYGTIVGSPVAATIAPTPIAPTPSATSSRGGGGAMELDMLLLLLAMAALNGMTSLRLPGRFGYLLAVAIGAGPLHAAVGDLDNGYGQYGIAPVPNQNAVGDAQRSVFSVLPDGRILYYQDTSGGNVARTLKNLGAIGAAD